VRLVARGAGHGPAVGPVLANEFATDAARGTDDQGPHARSSSGLASVTMMVPRATIAGAWCAMPALPSSARASP
jgi:hypothetical protein